MTLEELYELIGGNYEHAVQIMRSEKLIDRYVKKFENSSVGDGLRAAGEQMDAQALFESAHAMKGVCANLGFDDLAEASSEIAEEFRPGNARSFSDDEVKAKLQHIDEMYLRAIDGIKKYQNS